MHTHLPHSDPDKIRIVTLPNDGNDCPEVDKAFYEVTENPVSSLQELLIRMNDKLKQG